jgi:enolase-phosphatase E1
MIAFAGRGILLDIEGTTSSIRFVYDILFPFAREHVGEVIERRGTDPAVEAACAQVARDAGWTDWDVGRVLAEVRRLMDGDVKATGLKAIQGIVWKEGYARGQLRSHVYADVPPALADWRRRGIDVRIFSSGSVAAQKAFFGQTEAGDLLAYLNGHYDTTTGPKGDPDSYRRIADDMKLPPGEILFLSDVAAELAAACAAGLQTGLVVRPGNALAESASPVLHSFAEIRCNA